MRPALSGNSSKRRIASVDSGSEGASLESIAAPTDCSLRLSSDIPIVYSQQSSSKVAAGMSSELVPEPQTNRLWKNGAPVALGSADVDQPTLTLYAPLDRLPLALP
jgi:hypothetical protein